MFDEKFLRMWEFYLAGCEMAFKWGDQVVFQMQLIKNIQQYLILETIFIDNLLVVKQISNEKKEKNKKKNSKKKSF